MQPALFLQSAIQDPYTLYKTMLAEHPVYWDQTNGLWAVYSFAACDAVLKNPSAQIPPLNQNNKDGLNEYALQITKHLVRLSNDAAHIIARELAMLLFQKMKNISPDEIIEKLLTNNSLPAEKDFVSCIGKQLPAMVIAKSFDFADDDIHFIADKLESFTKIMAAVKTDEQVKDINTIAKELYSITEKHLLATGIYLSILKTIKEKYKIDPDEIMAGCVSNCIGMFIQGYDAGRGVLSNALLQFLQPDNIIKQRAYSKPVIEKSVVETLRFDPPVQNTRRVAVENILINNKQIKNGQTILVVLAAANRDPQKFSHPDKYDIERLNNHEHLTFGAGHHQCVAKHFSVNLATETFNYLFERYNKMKLLPQTIQYEPAVNVRLPKQLWIALT